jgi:hypothetical protein
MSMELGLIVSRCFRARFLSDSYQRLCDGTFAQSSFVAAIIQ